MDQDAAAARASDDGAGDGPPDPPQGPHQAAPPPVGSANPPPPPPPPAGAAIPPPPPPPPPPAGSATAAPPPVSASSGSGVPLPPPPPAPPDIADAFGSFAGPGRDLLSRLDPTGWRSTLTVAGILAAIVFGSLLLNAIIPARPTTAGIPGPGPVVPGPATPGPVAPGPATPGPVAPGQGIDMGNGVIINPPAGWTGQLESGRLRLQKGSVTVDVHVDPQYQGDAVTLVNSFVQQMQAVASQFTATPAQVIALTAGAPGARATYVGLFQGIGQPLEGQVTAMTLQGRGLVFDAYAPQGQLATGLPDVTTIINTVQVR